VPPGPGSRHSPHGGPGDRRGGCARHSQQALGGAQRPHSHALAGDEIEILHVWVKGGRVGEWNAVESGDEVRVSIISLCVCACVFFFGVCCLGIRTHFVARFFKPLCGYPSAASQLP